MLSGYIIVMSSIPSAFTKVKIAKGTMVYLCMSETKLILSAVPIPNGNPRVAERANQTEKSRSVFKAVRDTEYGIENLVSQNSAFIVVRLPSNEYAPFMVASNDGVTYF